MKTQCCHSIFANQHSPPPSHQCQCILQVHINHYNINVEQYYNKGTSVDNAQSMAGAEIKMQSVLRQKQKWRQKTRKIMKWNWYHQKSHNLPHWDLVAQAR